VCWWSALAAIELEPATAVPVVVSGWMSVLVESKVTPAAGVDQVVAELLVAVNTLPVLGALEGSVIPLILVTLGLAAVPLRSPSS
jgi:hypothetical protein